jgi:hypothetical protein
MELFRLLWKVESKAANRIQLIFREFIPVVYKQQTTENIKSI